MKYDFLKKICTSPIHQYNPSADDTFSEESLLLIDEITEKVKKLEQYGISKVV